MERSSESARLVERWFGGIFTRGDLSAVDEIVARYSGNTTYRGGLLDIPSKNRRILETGILIYRVEEGEVKELWSERVISRWSSSSARFRCLIREKTGCRSVEARRTANAVGPTGIFEAPDPVFAERGERANQERWLAFRQTGATIREVAGEQETWSLGSKRSARRRRVDSSGGSRRTYIIIGLIAAVFLAGFAALVIVDARQKAASGPPAGVQTYDVGPAGQHTEGNVDYAQTPPVGGPHNPVWQNCGFYNKPVRDENAVHSLEHGAVWITYQPDLPQDQVQRLRDIAQSQTYILVSPYPGLDSPVVASAWGKQLKLNSAEDPDLERFIRAYRQGPQTPEPGAVCTGGIGNPA